MKKWAFLFSGIVEVIGAIIIYFKPNIIFHDEFKIDIIYRLYAIALVSIGMLCLLVFKNYTKNSLTDTIFMIIMFFHAVITMMTYTADTNIMQQPIHASLTHGLLFVVFIIAYLNDIKPQERTQ